MKRRVQIADKPGLKIVSFKGTEHPYENGRSVPLMLFLCTIECSAL